MRWIAFLLSCGLVASLAAAQPAPQGTRPTVAAARIDSAAAPTIDGDLSDPGWARATVLQNFLQVEPVPGAPESERTVVRIMYDENNLYFGIYAYDSAPDQIAVRAMTRDGPLYTGDSVSITLDPGATRRNAYQFDMAPSGGRADALVLNNAEELDAWDPIWSGRARVVANGWIAEMAIPFRSLSYEPGQDWGFDFSRNISRKNEDVQWGNQNPALDFNDVSQTGTLTGIMNTTQGLGLDVQVYGALASKRDWYIPGDEFGISGTGGGNVFYRVTPALTATLTVNPDFSDAPLDARQVNTTRFSLFFPETRDFFLQDAAAFEFAGRSFSRGFDRTANNGRPFFSRNLGLVRGRPVSIIAGGKLSGEYGGFGIGALSVLTGKTETTSEQILSVARITHPVLEESRAGFVVTNGDPTGESDNTVAGGDFQYRNSNLFGDYVFTSDFYYERSFSSTEGDDHSYGITANFPNEPIFLDATFKHVGATFEPALGFINRTGINLYDANGGYRFRYRDSFLRTLEFRSENSFITELDGNLETRENDFSVDIEFQNTDELGLDVTNFFEDVPEPFDIEDTIIVPPGEYTWTNFGVEYSTSENRWYQVQASFACCSFYDGDGMEIGGGIAIRPSRYFEASADYDLSMFDMPGGSVDIHVLSADGVINFDPFMQLALQAQWDNISEDFGFLARYRWEFLPGSELLIAFGQSAVVGGSRFDARRSQLSIRVGHTFQF
jgi:hypothetical protein